MSTEISVSVDFMSHVILPRTGTSWDNEDNPTQGEDSFLGRAIGFGRGVALVVGASDGARQLTEEEPLE